MVQLDVGSLRDALAQLETSLAYCGSSLAQEDAGIARQFRSAAIQAFEFTYELAHKMLRRHLLNVDPSQEVVLNMSFQDLIREAYARGLVRGEWQAWSAFRKARGITSHSYNERSARQVFELIPGFAEEARFLLASLEQSLEQEATMRPVEVLAESEDLDTVRSILRRYLPQGSKVWAFGSRARGTRVRRGSDLDLAVDAGSELSIRTQALLSDAFEGSMLPYTVDVLDLCMADTSFRRSIEPDFIPFRYRHSQKRCVRHELPRRLGPLQPA